MCSSEEILQEIRNGAYWRLLLRPHKFVRERFPLPECQDIVIRSTVALRGWDFPHMSPDRTEWPDDSLVNSTRYHYFREYWKFYQSGQFVFLRRFKEDYFQAEARNKAASQGVFVPNGKEASGFSSIVEMIYCTTEFLDFSTQLSRKVAPDEQWHIGISMNGVKDRVLYLDNESMRTFNFALLATSEDLSWKKDLSCNDLLARNDEIAIQAVGHFLERFGWAKWRKSEDFLREEQSKLRSLYRK